MGLFQDSKKNKANNNNELPQSKEIQSSEAKSCSTKCQTSNKNQEMQELQFSKSSCKTGHKNNTLITVTCNCGFSNNLFIRGEGIPGLSWNKGMAMKNIKADQWCWETDKPFTKASFKVVLNDRQYESGENHSVECGKSVTCIPKF